ncbi:MAG: dihydrolipoamide acetyltransferase family protein [Planctomycetota bacterium]|jgi:pyruvate dehydrogenase E2 component (dihydrolipoamide acetyltransferase)
MPIEITMPRLSDTMESGTIIKWNVQEGDTVAAGDVVADIETDKATMEMQTFDDGLVARILVTEGQTVDVGTPIAVLTEEDEAPVDADDDAGAASAPAPVEAPVSVPAAAVEAPAPAGRPADGRVRVSPLARRLADEYGLDPRTLQGTGPGGRIIKRDVLEAVEAGRETAAAVAPSAAAPAPPAGTTSLATPVPMEAAPAAPPGTAPPESRLVPLSGVRQTIARRLVESKTTIPHYQVTMTFDLDPLLDLRRTINEQLADQGVRLSVNDFLVRACALAMYENPEFNASWRDDAVEIHGEVNIGVAVALPPERGGGLVVATLRHADRKSLRTISAEARALAEKARTRGLSLEEMADSTFTLSNLGMFGVEHFTAIINPPNSAILAVGGGIEKPVVRDGQLTIGTEMSGTLSCDHRIIDGAMAARYLQSLKGLIEQPAALMV